MLIKISLKRFVIALTSIIFIGTTGLVIAGDKSKNATRTPAATIKWADSDLGVKLFSVFGDSSKGPHITFVKFKGGQKTPPHTHTAGYTGVVVAGIGRHYLPGKPDTQTDLPVGSTWYMPANLAHISECMPGADCVFVVYRQDKFDFHEVKKK